MTALPASNPKSGSLGDRVKKGIRNSLFCCISILLISANVFAQEIPSSEVDFTEYTRGKIQKEFTDVTVTTNSPLVINIGDIKVNLHRIYGFCNSNHAQCSDQLDHYVQSLSQAIKESNTPPDKNSVRLIVRTSEYLKNSTQSGSVIISRPLLEGFVILPIIDTPRTVRGVSDKDLKLLSLSQDELFELGRTNLQANLKPLSEVAKPVKAGQIGTIQGTIYDPSRIISQSDWASLAEAQGGTLLVAMPTTDTLLYTSESTPVAIDALRTLSKQIISKATNPLTDKVLKWSSSGWQVLQ